MPITDRTTMFRAQYVGDNGALQNTKGWTWCESQQPGLTFLKWYYVSDIDPDKKVWTVIAPIELHIERGWSKKRDRQIDAIPEQSMRFAMGMLPDPYDVHEVRNLLGIPEPNEGDEPLDFGLSFAEHDYEDEKQIERLSWDLQRQRAMDEIDAAFGIEPQPVREEECQLDFSLLLNGTDAKSVGTPLTWTKISSPIERLNELSGDNTTKNAPEALDFSLLLEQTPPKKGRKAASRKSQTTTTPAVEEEALDFSLLFGES